MKQKHVYLIDDNEDIRIHLKGLLIQNSYNVHDFADGQSFIDALEDLQRPCVLVLDMRMPKLSGLELQDQLKLRNIFLPVIFISGESQHQEIISAMKNGAIEFLWKPFQSEQLITAIERGISLDLKNSNTLNRKATLQKLQASLSSREHEIFLLMHKGFRNKEIGEKLGVYSDTVKKHRAHILEKMQVTTLHELIALWDGIDLQD